MKAIGLVLIALSVVSAEMTLFDFFDGSWVMVQYRTGVSSGELPETQDSMHYTFEKVNGSTTTLSGYYYKDDERFNLELSFLGPFTGEWFTVKASPNAAEETTTEEHESSLVSLFKFNFVNLTSGHYVAQGSYGAKGTYQMIISPNTAPSFTMAVFEYDDADAVKEYTTIFAKKYIPPKEAGFFQ